MLAGLLFATRDATDRPDALAATLPFGGMTLIEFQARMLVAAGASQLILAVARLTPELLGAVNRIGRRGVAVDVVRNAEEAAARLHPLARVLMLADGLITADAVVAEMAAGDGDALLVVPAAGAPAGFERLGSDQAWAGVARLDPRRLAEVSGMPRDYDMQAALVRLAAQAGATPVTLPEAAAAFGHGIELRASALAARSRSVLAALVEQRTAWFDRWLVGPVARRALPALVERGTPAALPLAGAGVAGLLGLALISAGWITPGLAVAVAALVAGALGGTLAALRDEPGAARAAEVGGVAVAGCAVLLAGHVGDVRAAGAGATGLALAAALVGFAGIAERAIGALPRRRWWGSPAAYPLLLVPFALAAAPIAGVLAGAGYAAATLAAAVEALRRKA
jgi:hypothetical protein